MKKKFVAVFLLVMLAVSLTSCVKVDIDLKVKKNGKVDATVIFAMSEAAGDYGGSMDEMGFSEEELAEMKKNGWKVEAYSQDGYSGYRMFQSNIESLDVAKIWSTEGSGDSVLTKKGSTYVLDLPIGGILGEQTEEDPVDMVAMLRSFGASMKFRITLPVKPISHNAMSVSEDGKTLEWDLMSMQKGDRAHVEFKAGGGFLMYALIGAAVLAVLGVIFAVVGKKKNVAVPQQIPVYAPSPVQEVNPPQETAQYTQTEQQNNQE